MPYQQHQSTKRHGKTVQIYENINRLI